jgi:hypothetical protein
MMSPRIFGIFVMVTACSGASVKGPASVASGAHPVQASRFPEAGSERVRSRKLDLPLELMLPEKATWIVTEGPSWLEIEHFQSSSRFAFRTWRAERLVRRVDCAAQARLLRPTIPIANDESIIDRRPFVAPAGFDSELVVGVEPSAQGVTGYAVVFGASVGFCYAALFTTTVGGAGAEQEVAARLGVAVDRVFSSVRTRTVDDRAVRRRLVAIRKTSPEASPSETK